MSSRTPHPIQPDPRQTDPRHPFATTAGHRSLPLPNLLTKAPLPQHDYQPPYDSQSMQSQQRHAASHPHAFSAYPPVSQYSQPPPESHARPANRLILPRPYSPSNTGSPLSPSYASQHMSFGENQVYQSQRFHTHQVPTPRYQMHPDTLNNAPSRGEYTNPLVQLPLGRGRQQSAHTQPKTTQKITERYNLSVRQQPIAARACGFGERDRRVIDPPPIVQLSITDYDPKSSADVAGLKWAFNVVHCALLSVSPNGTSHEEDVTSTTDPNNAHKKSRRLMGTLVASPFVGIDPEAPPSNESNARLGCFFIFPDLSCRQNGVYRLRFTLMSINFEMLPEGGKASMIGTVESDVFEVYTAKDFPGMRASTALTKDLKRQGATVSVKKGNAAKAGKKGNKRGGNSDDSESDGSDAATSKTLVVKKKKDGG